MLLSHVLVHLNIYFLEDPLSSDRQSCGADLLVVFFLQAHDLGCIFFSIKFLQMMKF